MGGLSQLLVRHAELTGTPFVLREGPSGPALAALATGHYTSLCQELLRQYHRGYAEADVGGEMHAAEGLSGGTAAAGLGGGEGASDGAGAVLTQEENCLQQFAEA